MDDKSMTFAEHKERTAHDCEQVAELLKKLAAEVREGNMDAFEEFWWEGGTEEGDAKINALRENIIIRYVYRKSKVGGQTEEVADAGQMGEVQEGNGRGEG